MAHEDDEKENNGKKIEGEKEKGATAKEIDLDEILRKVTRNLAFMIDYLCIKLGWDTKKVLNNAHFDNERKLKLYLAIDDFERNRFISAIPLGFDKKVTTQLSRKQSNAEKNLRNIMLGTDFEIDKEDELKRMLGGSRENIEKFFKKIAGNQMPTKKLASTTEGFKKKRLLK